MPSSSPSCNRHTDSRYTRIGPNIYAPFSSKITRRINYHVPCFPPAFAYLGLWYIVSTHPRQDRGVFAWLSLYYQS